MIEDDDFCFDEQYIKKLSEKYKNVEHPLFMSELPKNIEENKDLEALYSLMVADENSISLAQNYKTVGNEYFKDGPKHYDDAIISYVKGVDMLIEFLKELKKEKNGKKETTDSDCNGKDITHSSVTLNLENKKPGNIKLNGSKNFEENDDTQLKNENNIEEKVKHLLADLYNNIAIVYLKKKNYVKCIDNCKKALSYNKKKFKCLYNCILCYYYMELFADASKYINMFDRLIQNEEDIRSVVNLKEYEKLKTEIIKKYENILNTKKKEEREREIRLKKEQDTLNQIKTILEKRNVSFVQSIYNNSVVNPVLYIDENLYIHFTFYLIYFEMNCIETILDFPENSTILDYYDIIKKNKNNEFLFCYLEFDNDQYFLINNSYYMCDIINMIHLFSPVMAMHITENEEAHLLFQQRNNVIDLKNL